MWVAKENNLQRLANKYMYARSSVSYVLSATIIFIFVEIIQHDAKCLALFSASCHEVKKLP